MPSRLPRLFRQRRWILAGAFVCALCLTGLAAFAASRATLGEAVQLVSEPIAFETPSGIQLVDAGGTGLGRLPGSRRGDRAPQWSPDGKRLAFWTPAAPEPGIHVADADGSDRRRLTPPPRGDSPPDQHPVWSPDGELIAFESMRSGRWHVWLMRADGSDARQVTPEGRGGWSPSWAPDGNRIVYVPEERWPLAIVDLSGAWRAFERLPHAHAWAPAWSPDGTRIAFASSTEHGQPELYEVAPAGGTVRRLTNNPAADFDPAWSPDGRQLLFSSGRPGLWELYVMSARGGEERRLTRLPAEYACCGTWRVVP